VVVRRGGGGGTLSLSLTNPRTSFPTEKERAGRGEGVIKSKTRQPAVPRHQILLSDALRTKTTGIRELRVPISGIWRLGFKNDDANEFRV
jgi:hypothetical protein